jgi:hypothetical protein
MGQLDDVMAEAALLAARLNLRWQDRLRGYHTW